MITPVAPLCNGHSLITLNQRTFTTLDELIGASEEDLQGIGEIGPAAASSIATFFADEEMKRASLELPNPDHEGENEGPLKDLKIVFTGRLERWTRNDAEDFLESSTVSDNTDYVVAGPDAASKLDEATERSIPLMNEEEFVGLLQERGVDLSQEG